MVILPMAPNVFIPLSVVKASFIFVNQLGIHYPPDHPHQMHSRMDTHYPKGFLPALQANL